jgi:hypothetical protein
MFSNEQLTNHLQESSTIRLQSAVVAEWNMNVSGNIHKVGNYRYRPMDQLSKYGAIPNTFDENDSGNFYTDATDSDIVIDGGYKDNGVPSMFLSKKQKENLLFSLEDCLNRFRPRSGINKLRYFDDKYSHFTNIDMDQRPRYYMADKTDRFKYWTSFRTEGSDYNEYYADSNGITKYKDSNTERGISKLYNNQYFIEDASPFVVYNSPVPANRLIVKMQTNTSNKNLGPFNGVTGSKEDPFYGYANATVPEKWKIQILQNNSWIDAVSFDKQSLRLDGSKVIGLDGYVELEYGLNIPSKFSQNFTEISTYPDVALLPESSANGNAYLIKSSELDPGTYYVWQDDRYEHFTATYGWKLSEAEISNTKSFVTDLTNPKTYTMSTDGTNQYKEFQYISGIRIVVETMNILGASLELIEMSPRLSANLSDKVQSFSVKKMSSDLGLSGLPIGQLLASTGEVTIFDYDQAFNASNSSSIVANYVSKNIQFKFYEIVSNVNGLDYYVPIKTLYSEKFPQISHTDRTASITLRDMYFYLESMTAPEIFIQNASLSYAVSMILDACGFSNYMFKRNPGETEEIIPDLFISPDKTVAQVLQDLAVSTQSAMFFDEYNNFIIMSKGYILPLESERPTDIILYGSPDQVDSGVNDNELSVTRLSNIIDIASQDNSVYNDGKITYNSKHIQKTISSTKQAGQFAIDQTWTYQPVLLWELSGEENPTSTNQDSSSAKNNSSYTLAAIPLNATLTDDLPTVKDNVVINNIIDFGEAAYWLSRYNGYFYANGEIIRYDAVEYSIPGTVGNVWITSNQEYQNYFSKISFNGKMYPTGRVRIYSEPNYEVVNGITKLKTGAVAKHGRMQFGTGVKQPDGTIKPAIHTSELDPYWYDNANVRGCNMNASYLFNLVTDGTGSVDPRSIVPIEGIAGIGNTAATKTTRNGVIRNFMSSSYVAQDKANTLHSTQSATVQSSALVMNGPSFATTETPINFVSYVYKPLTNKFKHFGTRVRVVGKINNSTTTGQTPVGSTPYYDLTQTTPDQAVKSNGASAGLAVMINPETNNGYYFEIIPLSENVGGSTSASQNIDNVIFYKVMKDPSDTDVANPKPAIPVKLWGGPANIIVDDGKFTGQFMLSGEQTPTVYDLSVEYIDIGTARRFFLYINNKQIATVDDAKPLTTYNNMALFVRGSARAMFENIYALTDNYSQNTTYTLDTPISNVFANNGVNVNESFRKYAMSGIIQSSYLSGISPAQSPKYDIYFDEFGTIMREAAYMNIRYDKAYPALSAKIASTYNQIKSYAISGFVAGAYGAEFLVFNTIDKPNSIDSTSNNFLKIHGVTFTQGSDNQLTVDDYFSKKSDFSNPQYSGSTLVTSPVKEKKNYDDIKFSRLTYGKNEFSLSVPYIQSYDAANNLMGWVISKIMKPRKAIGVKIFTNPTIQLGDIVKISYKQPDGSVEVAPTDTRFTVYNIEYQRDSSGPSMTLYLSEVI